MPAGLHPVAANQDRIQITVEMQGVNCRPSRWCFADDSQGVRGPCQVIVPTVGARMEQTNCLTRFRIGPIGSFGLGFVAQRTTEPKVLFLRRATSAAGNDVLDFE